MPKGSGINLSTKSYNSRNYNLYNTYLIKMCRQIFGFCFNLPLNEEEAGERVSYACKSFQSDADGMLKGVRVLDLSRLVSGNFLTLQLGNFGAEVIKVETLPDGDPFRHWHAADVALHWKEYCRNKKSISLNLRTQEGKDIFLRLAETADVVVENFRPGRMEEIGLGPDILLARNPKLIMMRLSGFGQTGPYREFGGFGTLVEAMSGYASRSGFEDREPVLPPLALADNIAGLTGAFAVAMALYHRDVHDGKGQVIDLSLLEPIYAVLGPEAARYKITGKTRKRSGSASNTSCPRNVYRTKDEKWLAMSAAVQTMAHRLFRAIGRGDMVDDPRYRTNADRIKRREEVDEIIGSWIRERTLDENLKFFRANDITAGPVYDITQIVDDPHFIEREILVEIPDEEIGSLPVHNVFPRFSGTPGAFYRPAPKLGEHNDEVLSGINLTEAEITKLRQSGVIG